MRHALVVVVVVVGAACAEPAPSCPDRTQLTIGSEEIGTEPREIDFGLVSPGLSASVRVSFVVACNLFVDGASAGRGEGGVFDVSRPADANSSQNPDVEEGEEGFVVVTAAPLEDKEAHGQLRINDDGGGMIFPLVVNAGR